MRVAQVDPFFPRCIAETRVELIAGAPCKIKVYVMLSPPPAGDRFPAEGENITSATLTYCDDAGNLDCQALGPPTGPDYSAWDSGSGINISFYADTWFRARDFATAKAQLTIKTDRPRTVTQTWYGKES
jgi:hypothetical protein